MERHDDDDCVQVTPRTAVIKDVTLEYDAAVEEWKRRMGPRAHWCSSGADELEKGNLLGSAEFGAWVCWTEDAVYWW